MLVSEFKTKLFFVSSFPSPLCTFCLMPAFILQFFFFNFSGSSLALETPDIFIKDCILGKDLSNFVAQRSQSFPGYSLVAGLIMSFLVYWLPQLACSMWLSIEHVGNLSTMSLDISLFLLCIPPQQNFQPSQLLSCFYFHPILAGVTLSCSINSSMKSQWELH